MTAKAEEKRTQLLDQAAETYFQAMKTGLRLQEEFAGRWIKLLQDSSKSDIWPERIKETASKAIPQMKDEADRAMKIMEQSSRQSMDLFAKALDVGMASSMGESQAKLQHLWEASLSALNSNAQTVIQTNARFMQCCAEMLSKTTAAAAAAASR